MYRGEVVGLILAMELIRIEIVGFNSVFIGTDNQATMKATTKYKAVLGHYLIDTFRNAMDNVIM